MSNLTPIECGLIASLIAVGVLVGAHMLGASVIPKQDPRIELPTK